MPPPTITKPKISGAITTCGMTLTVALLSLIPHSGREPASQLPPDWGVVVVHRLSFSAPEHMFDG
jgi:hypothetical protein